MPIVLELDDRKMKRFIRDVPKAAPRSTARALNKAITRARTVAGREVAAKRNIKVGDAKREMHLLKAYPNRLTASIFASGKPIKLYKVKGAKRQTKKGVYVRVEAKAKPHFYEGVKILKMKSGHIGVFRLSKTRKLRDNPKKAAIIEIALPSVAATMVQEKMEARLRAFAVPIYEAELVRLLNYEMTKAGAR